MEQWVSRETTTTTISHFDPSVSLLLLVSFLRRHNDVYICTRTARREKYENSATRFDSFYIISKWKILSGNSLTDEYVYMHVLNTQQDHLTLQIDFSFHLFFLF
jgi:hypothetical protein